MALQGVGCHSFERSDPRTCTMHPEQELQWGSAALRCPPPLLTLLRPPEDHAAASPQGRCRRLGAHATAVTALALHRPTDGGPTAILRQVPTAVC